MDHTITKEKALALFEELATRIDDYSSYFFVKTHEIREAALKLKARIKHGPASLDKAQLTDDFARIVARLGDRHAYVKYRDLKDVPHALIDKRFPFSLSHHKGKVLGLKHKGSNKYEYLYPATPYVTKIKGMPVMEFLKLYSYAHVAAPIDSFLHRGLSNLDRVGRLFYSNEETATTTLTAEFSNADGSVTTSHTFTLGTSGKRYRSDVENTARKAHLKVIAQTPDFSLLKSKLGTDENIGYLLIPRMYNYSDVAGLKTFFTTAIESDFSATKALIIDLRYNTGGKRDILRHLIPYFIKTEDPLVLNKAYLRKATGLPKSTMNSRGLYQKSSSEFGAAEVEAINKFNEFFVPSEKIRDFSKFHEAFYMVLKKGAKTYDKQVYLLVNEVTFSAASVFTAAVKGFRNVTIVGIKTDASSGNSKRKKLGVLSDGSWSRIEVKNSTMVSYQKDGKLFDGYGTEPDIKIVRTLAQVLGTEDFQLKHVIEELIDTD